jgi:hypothetical protein
MSKVSEPQILPVLPKAHTTSSSMRGIEYLSKID